MKLLKIGRSSSCNIVLHSDKVSTFHAEMILLDNGEIILEDKNSTNGTFVGNQQVTPNTEVTVRRGDYIRFGDVELSWAHVPALENNSKYTAIVSIGTNFRNDILINGAFPSRFHATLKVAKDKKAYIKDLDSKNGTKVNGVKIQSGKEVQVKRGDIVICGDVDVTEQIAPFIPKPISWIKIAVVSVGIAAVFVGIFFLIRGIIPDVKPDQYRPAVVYVRARYHYVVTLDDNPIPELWSGKLTFQPERPHQATAFFIDREGRMATNRHVAVPWDNRSEAESSALKQKVTEYLDSLILLDKITANTKEEEIYLFNEKELGHYILKAAKERSQATGGYIVNIVNTMINRLKKSSLTITGELDYITVGYPGRNYTHTDEFERCDVLRESGTADKDIAILQLNSKQTPDKIKYIFDVKDFNITKLEPLKDKLYTIGYPMGIEWGMDSNTKSLEPTIRETKCSKVPSKYHFEFQDSSVGGSSGSPVFDKKGHLVGILFGGYTGGATMACQARYLQEMYKEEVGL